MPRTLQTGAMVLLFLLVVSGAALRFYKLDLQGLALGEAAVRADVIQAVAEGDMRSLWTSSAAARSRSPLFMAALYATAATLGDTPAWLRVPSLVVSVGMMVLVLCAAGGLVTLRTRMLYAAFFASAFGLFTYGQELRSYSFYLFFATLGWCCVLHVRQALLEGVVAAQLRWCAALCAALVLMVFSQFVSALPACAMLGWLGLVALRQRQWTALLSLMASGLVLLGLFWWWGLNFLSHSAFAQPEAAPNALFPEFVQMLWPSVFVAGGMLVFIVAGLLCDARMPSSGRSLIRFCAGFVVVCLALYAMLLMVSPRPLHGRYFLGVAPALLMLAALCTEALYGRFMRAGALVLLGAALLCMYSQMQMLVWASVPHKPQFGPAADYISQFDTCRHAPVPVYGATGRGVLVYYFDTPSEWKLEWVAPTEVESVLLRESPERTCPVLLWQVKQDAKNAAEALSALKLAQNGITRIRFFANDVFVAGMQPCPQGITPQDKELGATPLRLCDVLRAQRPPERVQTWLK